MTRIAFLLTNRYQMFHYAPIARALGEDCTFVIERREQDFEVTEAYVDEYMPGAPVDCVDKPSLRDLDGRYQLIVSQTPPLAHALLEETLVVAQQYSLSKERYQYGAWRTLPQLNLMYGPYSVSQVQGFARAVATGNAMFDAFFNDERPGRSSEPRTGLYLPTYGSLSSLPVVAPELARLECEVVVKLHHMDEAAAELALPDNCTVVRSDVSPVSLLADADFVISDFSGAAFDALYAGKPLLVAGPSNPSPTDQARLSRADIDRVEIRELAAEWVPGMALTEAIDLALSKMSEAAHRQFVDRFYVNHGSAAKAAADAILEILDRSASDHWGRSHVSENYREQLVKVRQLRTDLRAKSKALKRAESEVTRLRSELDSTKQELVAARSKVGWLDSRLRRLWRGGMRRLKRTIKKIRRTDATGGGDHRVVDHTVMPHPPLKATPLMGSAKPDRRP